MNKVNKRFRYFNSLKSTGSISNTFKPKGLWKSKVKRIKFEDWEQSL